MSWFLIYVVISALIVVYLLLQYSCEVTDYLIEDIIFLTGIGERTVTFLVYIIAFYRDFDRM